MNSKLQIYRTIIPHRPVLFQGDTELLICVFKLKGGQWWYLLPQFLHNPEIAAPKKKYASKNADHIQRLIPYQSIYIYRNVNVHLI